MKNNSTINEIIPKCSTFAEFFILSSTIDDFYTLFSTVTEKSTFDEIMLFFSTVAVFSTDDVLLIESSTIDDFYTLFSTNNGFIIVNSFFDVLEHLIYLEVHRNKQTTIFRRNFSLWDYVIFAENRKNCLRFKRMR